MVEWMVKALGQLGKGLLVLHGGQGNFGLELGTVRPAFGAHRQILLFGLDLQLTPLSQFWGPPPLSEISLTFSVGIFAGKAPQNG